MEDGVLVKLGLAAVMMVGLATGSSAMVAQTLDAQAIPDSPRPQAIPNAGAITPGKGIPASTSATPADNAGAPPPSATLPGSAALAPEAVNDPVPDMTPELGPGGRVQTIRANVNFVQIPFTVKDKNGQLVPALTWRDVQVFENGSRKQMRYFTSDPYPLAVAFVIDQTLPFQVMTSVNTALGALQGAFTPYDEMAIFTYNNGTTLRTDYTGAQSARINAIIERSKVTGREAYLASPMGPLSQTINTNGRNFDPNTAPNRSCPSCTFQAPPKETHALNDAIFAAAQSLAKRPDKFRRMIYVISDGKESGSKASFKDNIRFLQTNKIAVYATVVGDSATPYVGFLDHYHIPFTMRENILPQYAVQTGGEAVSEYRVKGIETSFAKIAEDVRVQYTVGYYSNEPITDNKFRTVEVQVLRSGLNVVAKKGYYPTPENVMRSGGGVGASPAPKQ
jgi:VWFA-related protein